MGKQQRTRNLQPANLTEAGKAKLMADIMATFPALRMFEAEVAALVEGYSENRHFGTKLMQRAEGRQEGGATAAAAPGVVRNLAPGDPEYEAAIAAMQKADEQAKARQAEIEAAALKEQAEKAAAK